MSKVVQGCHSWIGTKSRRQFKGSVLPAATEATKAGASLPGQFSSGGPRPMNTLDLAGAGVGGAATEVLNKANDSLETKLPVSQTQELNQNKNL